MAEHRARTRFECANPILSVADMARSLRYYLDVLGFANAAWGGDDFTCVSRDEASIYLSRGRGRGSASTTSTSCTKSTERRARRSCSRRKAFRGPARCELAIRTGTCFDSGPSRKSHDLEKLSIKY